MNPVRPAFRVNFTLAGFGDLGCLSLRIPHLPRMKLVAVSVVKNEADVIEAFVRHTQTWVDEHLVFDHDSTDGTREILGALQREGLRLSLFTDDAIGNLQQTRSNHLSRLAAEKRNADWVVLLDADEFLAGPDRAGLETALAAAGPSQPVALPLLNYHPTSADDPSETNPARRLRHCQRLPGPTGKVMVPRSLALDASVRAGKGNHALYREGRPLPATPLPQDYWLAHLALRSPGQQAMRVVLAELQKLSRGRSHAGLDMHYRLGFQLLSENPERFFNTICHSAAKLRLEPVDYRGGPLRYSSNASDWSRVARAMLPFLEKLAHSHGQLIDAQASDSVAAGEAPVIRELRPDEMPPLRIADATAAFAGFTPLSGWAAEEGPVPHAFLPPFHWGLAPETLLKVDSPAARRATLVAEALTYSEDQSLILELNGSIVARHVFARINEKQPIVASLPLIAGSNQLAIRYHTSLQTSYDPRRLAVIYLSLRIG
ncbi:MAG: glycosyltransferase family 2 protein [Opitutae bacterium]|nr:glycosyltransferase family 2 protein [Opitutae bacterium]